MKNSINITFQLTESANLYQKHDLIQIFFTFFEKKFLFLRKIDYKNDNILKETLIGKKFKKIKEKSDFVFALAKSKYEKNVYTILKVYYKGTITTKKMVARPLLLKV